MPGTLKLKKKTQRFEPQIINNMVIMDAAEAERVAISNNPVKNKPSTVKFPIQINGLSNQFMPVLSEYG